MTAIDDPRPHESAPPPDDPRGTDDPGRAEEPRPSDETLPEAPPLSDADEDARIERQLREHGVRLGWGGVAPAVFWPALLIVAGVSVWAVIKPEAVGEVFNGTQTWIVDHFSWLYILSVGLFVAVALAVGLSRLGKVVIGRDGDEPEFGLLSWFAMLFAAGMGIGLVFYGVAEPLSFATVDPKPGVGAGREERAHQAFAQTFLHWGVHPWAIYVVVGLSLALAIHRRGRPVSIRWALEPLFGDRVRGPLGDVVDVLAIVGTVFGVATSLGLGVTQIGAGLAHMGVVDSADNRLLVILIVIITFLATLSVVSGVGKGIKWLSNINLSMAGLLLLAVLVFGPTTFLLSNMVESLGTYLGNVLNMTFDTSAYTGEAGKTWQSSWSIFYWGWWISWAPFVGVFIARISRGRTVREFVFGALLVPMLVAVVWFSVMGGTGLYREYFGKKGLVVDGSVTAENVLFDTLEGLPMGSILAVMAIILVAVFFITSSDSGSLVVDMLASGGHPDPPTWSRVLWALLEGAIAISLLLAGGKDGLAALQAGAIATALPFCVVLLLMAVALVKVLRKDHAEMEAHQLRVRREEFKAELADSFHPYVDDRIDYRLSATRGPHLRRPGMLDRLRGRG